MGDAAPYSEYADYCRYLVRNVIGPMVRTYSVAFNVPLQGWDQLFSVVLLVRAKLMVFGLDKPDTLSIDRNESGVLCLHHN